MKAHLGLALATSAVVFSLLFTAGFLFGDSPYRVSVTLDSAASVVEGAPVLVNGFEAGSVQTIEVVDGKAKITFELEDDFAPLHDGATASIVWKAVLSERQIDIRDGEAAEIPSGGALRGTQAAPVEMDQILAALDEPTRDHLKASLEALRGTLEGSEGDVNATIASAGPAVQELSGVLKALGTDGPAIQNLVVRTNDLVSLLSTRQSDVQNIVSELADATTVIAERRTELRESLTAMPGVLDQATATLNDVPDTVSDVEPLLKDLSPATAQLSTVSADLAPLLTDLAPLVGDLRPLLAHADALLDVTPSLLQATDSVIPSATSLVTSLQTPVEFLRPYTPEITGLVSTWASSFANYDSNGNFARIFIQAGTTSFNENPGIVPPGITYDPYPMPGAVVGQPWTDAAGEELR